MADMMDVNSNQEMMGTMTDTTHPSFTNSAAKGDSERKDQSRYGDNYTDGVDQAIYNYGRDTKRKTGPSN